MVVCKLTVTDQVMHSQNQTLAPSSSLQKASSGAFDKELTPLHPDECKVSYHSNRDVCPDY